MSSVSAAMYSILAILIVVLISPGLPLFQLLVLGTVVSYIAAVVAPEIAERLFKQGQ